MSEWKEYKLGDLVTFQRGHDLPRNQMLDGNFPVAGSNSIIGFHHDYTTKGPGITIGRSGNIGNPQFYKTDFWAHNTVLYVKEFKLVDPVFFYYLLKTIDFSQLNSGSAVPSLNRNFIHPFVVKIPSDITTQTAIAEILSSLDDKIELNNKINLELEQLAQTLFKQWFIDFEFPNENGEPYKSSGGEMVESELGEIPKGWEVRTIGEITEVITKGTTPTSIGGKFTDSGINFIKVESLTEEGKFIKSKFGYIDEYTNQLLKRSIIKEGDILFSIAGTIGRVAVVTKDILPANTNQAIAILRPSNVESNFLRLLMKSTLIQNETKSSIVQAVQANLSLGVIKSTKFIKPSNEIEKLFNNTLIDTYNKIESLSNETEELTNLRDTLLPKLISGELAVSSL